MDLEGLVQVYVALSALEPPPDITESIVITTKLLAEKSAPLTKEFVEQLSKSVSGRKEGRGEGEVTADQLTLLAGTL